MERQERHSQILAILRENSWTWNSEILRYLWVDIDRKTLQRDLKELEEQYLISSIGSGRGLVYSLSEIFYMFTSIDVEQYFSVAPDKRDIKEKFDFDIFPLLENDIFNRTESELLHNSHTVFMKNFGKYTSQTLINKEFERIMIEFSWKSSQIEGNTYSLLSTEALIKENRVEEGKTDEETQMILNHKDAFNEALQNRERFSNLSVASIEYLHSVLTKDLGISKNIRSHAVGITGTKYSPLGNAFQIQEALEKMVLLINKKADFFEKSFLTLVLWSYIQAFEDGNKRTARMISNAILLSFGAIPLSYRAVDAVEYKKASLLFYEVYNLTYFKEIFMKQYAFAVENYFQ